MTGRIALLLLGVLLSGCIGRFADGEPRLSSMGQSEAATVPQSEPRYCYRTLGAVNCYAQPLPGKEANRLLGYDGPAPRSSAGTGPLTP